MADQEPQAQRQLALHRIYLREFSFESQNTPEIFTSTARTENQLNVSANNREIGPEQFEVTLTVKVKSSADGTPVFDLEVAQAGIFTITGYPPEERLYLLGSVCPSALYPYAREAVQKAAVEAGFGQLLLQPLDFDSMFAENMRERVATPDAAT